MSDELNVVLALNWFSERGYSLAFVEADGFVWADLVRLSDGAVSMPRYGRGDSEAGAAQRARERWEQEQ